MPDWYTLYVKRLQKFRKPSGSSFHQTLIAAKSGHPASRRSVMGSSLWIVLDVAKEFEGRTKLPMHELIEEGNAAMEKGFDTFTGEDLVGYRSHIEDVVRESLKQYLHSS
jgi:DNA-directed RNA polymerase sigma subunit (sigma70/sigma32)